MWKSFKSFKEIRKAAQAVETNRQFRLDMANTLQHRHFKSAELSSYRDQHFRGNLSEQEKRLRQSTTLYIGNLSFYTTEEQIFELFSKCGDIKRIIMGLDKIKKTPCGFCFVEFYRREDAKHALMYISGTRLDDRIIRGDWDAGFVEGRQYGRGKSGGQVRDEYRTEYDSGRGGYGKAAVRQMQQQQHDRHM